MGKKVFKGLSVMLAVLILGLSTGQPVFAGNKSLTVTQREIYQNDGTESMRDVHLRREKESKEYKQEVLANGEETVRLLREIKGLLKILIELERKDSSSE